MAGSHCEPQQPCFIHTPALGYFEANLRRCFSHKLLSIRPEGQGLSCPSCRNSEKSGPGGLGWAHLTGDAVTRKGKGDTPHSPRVVPLLGRWSCSPPFPPAELWSPESRWGSGQMMLGGDISTRGQPGVINARTAHVSGTSGASLEQRPHFWPPSR